ncbi:hypothetical protein [Paraburkholderia sp. GAS348]|uniref:hypothetical protein n=1 Tax=Paraburkholderia sp. GAS348 TaxID=3035132 RepID=UPI003D1D4B0A
MIDSIYRAFTQREWADLERRHAARGGRPVVRADSASAHDQPMDASGLFVHRELDLSNRPIFTFSLPEGVSKRDSWMAPYCGVVQLQTALTNDTARTRRLHQQFLVEHGL